MTLPPNRIGDKGQRYEVLAVGYPDKDKASTIGWNDSLNGAKDMAQSIFKAPGCTEAYIIDRERRQKKVYSLTINGKD